MSPDDFVGRLRAERASAILRTDSADTAAAAMEAAIRGGFSVCEFTLTVPDAFELIRDFSRRHRDVVFGAGTVLEPDEADRAVAAGARFLVSPVVDEAVIQAAVERRVAAMPGTHTPTEMLRAHRAGAVLQKLFPAPAGGPAYVKACLGPMPFLNIVPTNGVDADNAQAWLKAGALAVGFVAPLFDPALMAAADYAGIEARARRLVGAISGNRGQVPGPCGASSATSA